MPQVGGIPLERVDWALAGTSSSSVVEDGPNGPITRGQWRRWIDSRATDTANVIDEGVNYPQSDGTILEKGRMVNPATGTDQEYEELWRDQDILPAGFPRARAVVLQFDEGLEYRGSIVRVGQYCQGILRKGDHMTTERWEWTAANNWTKTVSFGGDTMPTHLALDEHVTVPLQEGQAHEFGGVSWKVIEVAEL